MKIKLKKASIVLLLETEIDSPYGPTMHWHVPSSPERIDIVGVPPVGVKIPICKV